MVVQWLRLCTSNAEGMDSIPGQGTKIPHAARCSKKKKKKKKEKLNWKLSHQKNTIKINKLL